MPRLCGGLRAAATLWAMARGLPPIRVDAVSFVVTGLSVVVFLGTAKLVAYKFHGNPIAQAWLTLF